MLTFEEALSKIIETVTPCGDSEPLPLSKSLNRVSAKDVIAPIALPQKDNSAMDGFAIRFEDLKKSSKLTLIGKSYAGQPYGGSYQEGECIRIMTGGMLPCGTDTVIMQEDTEQDGNKVHILKHPSTAGLHVRHVGEDAQAGEVVVKKNTALKAQHIGFLASLGIAEVEVFRLPVVALASTGDELVSLGKSLKEGYLYDSNRYLLGSLLKPLGIEPLDFENLPDNPQILREQLLKMSESCDVIITSGGISVGDRDYIKEILEGIGKIFFWKVAIKPGKPFAFGQIGRAYFFGLPGNPVSAMVTFEQLVKPALYRLMGQREWKPLDFKARSLDALKKEPGRMDFQRGILKLDQNGEWVVTSAGSQSSGVLSSFCKANCYIVLPSECTGIKAGEFVCVQPFQ